MANHEYGVPIYMTVNASDVNVDVNKMIKVAIEHANEINSTLYLTVNSGKPPDPPIIPPGGNG
jgi:hypothetical protein